MTAMPPGPPDSRQELLRFARDPLTYFLDLANSYGEVAFARIATRDTYVLTSPEALRVVLIDQAEKFVKTDHTREATSTFLGDGLLSSAGPTHRRHRRTMKPVFTPEWVAGYLHTMVDYTNEMIAEWQEGEVRDVAADMMRLTLNIIGKTVFGVERVGYDEALTQATGVMQHYSSDTLVRGKLFSVTEQQVKEAISVLDSLVTDVLTRHGNVGARDLVTLLRTARDPETGQGLSDREVRDEALTLLMAGHETTANALAWTLYLLATHPSAETEMRREIRDTLDGSDPTVESLHSLYSTERVMKEALRLYPPVWLFGRTPIEPVDVCGYAIGPGANIVISPYVIHRNSRYWPDAEQFRPERFEAEPARLRYLPFGAGPRICLGQPFAMLETVVVLVTILQRYRLTMEPGHQVEPEPRMTLRPKGGLPMRVSVVPEPV